MHGKFTLMATVGADRKTHIVDTRSWKKVASLSFGYRSVAFHHRLPLLAVGGDDHAAVYDLSRGCSEGMILSHRFGRNDYTPHFVHFLRALDLLCVWTRWRILFFKIGGSWERVREIENNNGIRSLGGPYLGYKPMISFHPTRPLMVRRNRDRAVVSRLHIREDGFIEIEDLTVLVADSLDLLDFLYRGHIVSVAMGPQHVAVCFLEATVVNIMHDLRRMHYKQTIKVYELDRIADGYVSRPPVKITPKINLVPIGRVSGVLDAAVYFHPSKPRLAVACHRFLVVYDANSGVPLHRLNNHNACINDVAFHPRHPLLATSASDKRQKTCVYNLSPSAPATHPAKRGRWSEDEISVLMDAVKKKKKEGSGSWADIALVPAHR